MIVVFFIADKTETQVRQIQQSGVKQLSFQKTFFLQDLALQCQKNLLTKHSSTIRKLLILLVCWSAGRIAQLLSIFLSKVICDAEICRLLLH